eukprot:scaffold111433_cov18-Tisochrysis_lutea.AAC.2
MQLKRCHSQCGTRLTVCQRFVLQMGWGKTMQASAVLLKLNDTPQAAQNKATHSLPVSCVFADGVGQDHASHRPAGTPCV